MDWLAREIVDSGVASAVALAAGAHTGRQWVHQVAAAGRLGSGAGQSTVEPATWFDLASLTKSVTALTAARLARAGELDFAAPLGRLIPEVQGTPCEDVSLDLLLSHRAGLEPHRRLYRHLQCGRIVAQARLLEEAASARRADGGAPMPFGWAPVYSDLGYLLAGEAIARATGGPLDEAMERHVLLPLGLHLEMGSARRLAARDASFSRRVALTEIVPWRGGVLAGVVHDENAWAYAGAGAAGHAGLFGTAGVVLRLGTALIDCLRGKMGDFLTASELDRLVAPRPLGTLRAGFDGKSEQGSSAGSRFGPRSFGHLGFTGTSVWCDPDRQWVGVVLTNRVHPTRSNDAIRAARPAIYDRLAQWAAATQDQRLSSVAISSPI
jgi:CubicO group peptidase (beta-lactamase class C family)